MRWSECSARRRPNASRTSSSNDVDPRDALALQQAKNEAAKLDVEKLKLQIQLAEIQGKQGN